MSKTTEHRADIPSGAVTDVLASMLAETSFLIAWNRRVGRNKVDGVPLAEHHPRFKRPDDVIYHKQTHEAIMGADIITSRGLDDEIVDITSGFDTTSGRDRFERKPDLVLHHRDGTGVYVEFTRACVDLDERNNETIRAVNRRLRTELSTNQPVDHDGNPVSPHITLRARPDEPLDEERLFQEALSWIRTPTDEFAVPGPLLASLGTTFWSHDSPFRGDENVVVQFFESRDLHSLTETVRERITKKTGRGYPQRPLWLFISISESWANRTIGGAYVEFLEGARDGSLTFDLGDFDRVAVGVTGRSVWLKSSRS
jgi:hypothetical protein